MCKDSDNIGADARIGVNMHISVDMRIGMDVDADRTRIDVIFS